MEIPEKMIGMVLRQPTKSLVLDELPVPQPGPEQVLIRVHACGVCRTDLHIADAELPNPTLPLVLGHEIVGSVVQTGSRVEQFRPGDRVGVPWVAYTCNQCRYCKTGRENLCDRALFTGYTVDGGYAEYAVAHHQYCFHIPVGYADLEVAPLLCAGMIGYRSYRMAGESVGRLGIYGFGAAAHIVTQIAVFEGKSVYAFTKPGDGDTKEFARGLGAIWTGDSTEMPPEELDAAIIFAPVGSLVPAALKATSKGGAVVCAGIHMSDIPTFPYRILWEERVVRSVANLTRKDGEELLAIAPKVPVETEVRVFKLEEANEALDLLRQGNIKGAGVLKMSV